MCIEACEGCVKIRPNSWVYLSRRKNKERECKIMHVMGQIEV